MVEKRRVTIYVHENIWKEFLKKLIEKRGKAAGGAISEEVENAIKKWLRD
jgi:uncharacterized membrane protein